jgi:hypothetical protein
VFETKKKTKKKIEERNFLVVVIFLDERPTDDESDVERARRRQRDVADDENVPQRFEIGICSHLFPRANAVLLYRGPQSRLFFGFPVPSKRSSRRGRSRCVFPSFHVGSSRNIIDGVVVVRRFVNLHAYSFFLSFFLSLSLSLSFRARAHTRTLSLSLSFSFFLATKTALSPQIMYAPPTHHRRAIGINTFIFGILFFLKHKAGTLENNNIHTMA